ncbi:MAG: putative lipid II flippase MurJ [Rhodomicrobium sp.]|nr:MAG: putative lipid II flippase MurJ [Rhodomicrobium sp.]
MRLYKAFATVGGLTMISRMLGFIRDILIAFVLGTGFVADAFFVAFRFPNLFRRLFGEGAFNAAFVPLFAKKLEGESQSAARQFSNQVASVLIVALLVTTALAEITMPWLIYLIAPGFSENPEKLDLAIILTRITFPYLACMSLVALLSGMLNALDKFAAAAAVPVLLNIILIAVMGTAITLGFENSPAAGHLLSWGVAAAGFAQLFLLIYCVLKEGYGISLQRPRLTPDVKRFLSLSVPGIIAGGITQINIMIGTIIASQAASAVSYLYYADRLYQLPLGIVGIAIGVVLLPELSRKLRANDMVAVNNAQNRSLEFSALLTLPAAVALFVAAEPIIEVLFERGAFGPEATKNTAAALQAFAIGLPSFVLIKVFSPGFFAREDTKTPMYFASFAMLLNIVLSLLLFSSYQHVGIAAATTIAGWANAILLGVTLYRRGIYSVDQSLAQKLPLILVSSAMMGVSLYGANLLLDPYFDEAQNIFTRFLALAALVTCGLLTYALSAQITGAARLKDIRNGMRKTSGQKDKEKQ